MLGLIKKIFGTKHERDVKKLRPLVARINQIEQEYQRLSDDQLKAKTQEFKERLNKGETLDDIMPEAYAAVKNACRRLCGSSLEVCGHQITWDMIPFDVQLIGGIVLHQGKIAEMATGEGKTLVATLPLYLNALAGKSVHLVTVNDYLAKRDSQWMGHLLSYMGISVGCIQNHMNFQERKTHYAMDVTYGTNSEFGFDYLRDNGMAFSPEGQVQRQHYYAIIDEVDSILIDEARTPLIISGAVPHSTHQYEDIKPRVEELVQKQRTLCNRLIQEAKEYFDKGDNERGQRKLYQVRHGMPKHKQLAHMLEDAPIRKLLEQADNMMITDMHKEEARALREELYFVIDERQHEAALTDKGCTAMNPNDLNAFVLPDLVAQIAELEADKSLSEVDKIKEKQKIQQDFAEKSERVHNVDQLIKAYCLFEKDVDYVVQDNQVLIVDEFTGRILPGRRWSDGLHQAVEAKEGAKIENETQTLATITIQNYFRMYSKLAGMTGTAETEANEFREIYKLDVVVIPTNRPVRRIDHNDVIYKTQREKFKAIIDQIQECHQRGQPVLVGTISVEMSELLSRMLKRSGIPHNVLNAKNHEREAEIVTRAGQPGTVTIATNMAGRGTDIKLGPGVIYLDKETIIKSDINLNSPYEGGRSLRAALLEKPCGLYVIGSERHESRRIDRQLRGRCARQGDPGMSRFFTSLEDDLMRLFGSDRLASFIGNAMEEGQPLEHWMLNRSIETAQRRVEQQNFSIRKRTLEYDDVMNRQREVIYKFRGDIVRSPNVREFIYDILEEIIAIRSENLMAEHTEEGLKDFVEWVQTIFPVPISTNEFKAKIEQPEAIAIEIFDRVKKAYDLKIESENPDSVLSMERHILLNSIDEHWQDYLRSMDELRHGVGLRAYGQRDPLVEYKKEAFSMFEELMDTIKSDLAQSVFRATTNVESFARFLSSLPQKLIHDEVSILGKGGAPSSGSGPAASQMDADSILHSASAASAGGTVRRDEPKVGRNDPCPCGSGKKYKKCCGK